MRRATVAVVALALAAGSVQAGPRVYPGPLEILAEPLASPYRVHVARMTEVTLAPGGPPSEGGGHLLDRTLEVPVVEERAGLVRALLAHDDARTMVWIDEDDLAWSIARPVRLAGRGDAGVWLTTGAPVTVSGKGAKRTITFADRGVKVSGAVGADDLARVFPVSQPLQPTFGPTASRLRVRPGGAILYRGQLSVEIVSRRAGWIEVEHRSRYLRIRGWVDPANLSEDLLMIGGTGSGSGFAISDVERVVVPAGACLFDRAGGEVVALQLATTRRYVSGKDGDWWQLYLGTPWGTVLAWGHALGTGDAGQPTWERCTPRDPAEGEDDDAFPER